MKIAQQAILGITYNQDITSLAFLSLLFLGRLTAVPKALQHQTMARENPGMALVIQHTDMEPGMHSGAAYFRHKLKKLDLLPLHRNI